MYKKWVLENIMDFPAVLSTARQYPLKWERYSASVPEGAGCWTEDGKEADGCVAVFGCAAVWQSVCVSRSIRSGHFFDHQITRFSLPTPFLFSSKWEGYSKAFFNAPVALNLCFHSRNESWSSCPFLGQNQTKWYFPLMFKAHKNWSCTELGIEGRELYRLCGVD